MPWKVARKTFYWRLRRLILQHRVLRTLTEAQPNLTVGQGEAMLRRWFLEDLGTTEVRNTRENPFTFTPSRYLQGYKWDNNEEITKWIEYQTEEPNSLLNRNISAIKKDYHLTGAKTHFEVSELFFLFEPMLFSDFPGVPRGGCGCRC